MFVVTVVYKIQLFVICMFSTRLQITLIVLFLFIYSLTRFIFTLKLIIYSVFSIFFCSKCDYVKQVYFLLNIKWWIEEKEEGKKWLLLLFLCFVLSICCNVILISSLHQFQYKYIFIFPLLVVLFQFDFQKSKCVKPNQREPGNLRY